MLRRASATLIVLSAVVLNPVVLRQPSIGGVEAQAITMLRAVNAAQLLYQTSVGQGRYANNLAELDDWLQRPSGFREYRIELIPDSTYYAVIAVPIGQNRNAHRALCVDDRSSIFQTPGG